MSATVRHTSQVPNALDNLDEQPFSLLTGPIARHELSVHCVLRRLCVVCDRKSDRVFRVGPKIVAYQFHYIRRETGVSEFPASLLHC